MFCLRRSQTRDRGDGYGRMCQRNIRLRRLLRLVVLQKPTCDFISILWRVVRLRSRTHTTCRFDQRSGSNSAPAPEGPRSIARGALAPGMKDTGSVPRPAGAEVDPLRRHDLEFEERYLWD